MDPRTASQRRGAVLLVVFFALLLGMMSGVLLATGLDWVPHTQATDGQNADLKPSEFLTNTQESFRDLVAAVRPAVVSIQAEGQSTAVSMMPFDMQDPFKMFGMPSPFDNRGQGQGNGQEQGPDQYMIPEVAAGSGFIVDPKGYILTNNHVVANADKVKVVLDSGKEYQAQIVWKDPDTDVAVLKIEDQDPLPYVELGDSDALQVGDWVMAIGNPFGYLAGTVTIGIVSATNREYLQLPGDTYYQNFIQTDAAINLGNSGGPLVDIYGHVVGINTAIAAQGSGIGFATPINMAKFVYDSYMQNGEVVRGWIGVTIQNLDGDLAKTMGLGDTRGSLVAEVRPGEPADKAGLKAEDVILEVGGQKVVSTQTASRLIAALPVGKPADMKIWRDGREMTITVTPVRREVAATAQPTGGEEKDQGTGKTPKNEEYLGLQVEELNSDIIREYDLPEGTAGVVVTGVEPGSSAYAKGLGEGVVIVAINRQDIDSLDTYERLMSEAHDAWKKDGSNVLIRFLLYDQQTGWTRQFMALPFE